MKCARLPTSTACRFWIGYASRGRLIRPKRIKQWTFYRRDETRIRALKKSFLAQI
jgi:hypothetical protein